MALGRHPRRAGLAGHRTRRRPPGSRGPAAGGRRRALAGGLLQMGDQRSEPCFQVVDPPVVGGGLASATGRERRRVPCGAVALARDEGGQVRVPDEGGPQVVERFDRTRSGGTAASGGGESPTAPRSNIVTARASASFSRTFRRPTGSTPRSTWETQLSERPTRRARSRWDRPCWRRSSATRAPNPPPSSAPVERPHAPVRAQSSRRVPVVFYRTIGVALAPVLRLHLEHVGLSDQPHPVSRGSTSPHSLARPLCEPATLVAHRDTR